METSNADENDAATLAAHRRGCLYGPVIIARQREKDRIRTIAAREISHRARDVDAFPSGYSSCPKTLGERES
jgi:hypothetical protein